MILNNTVQSTNNKEAQAQLQEALAEKFGIPLSVIQHAPKLEHKSVLNALQNEMIPIDFRERAKLDSAETIARKHYVIISNESILETALNNKWSLCMSNGFIYVYNGAYWKQMPKELLLDFLGKAALKLGVDEFEAKHFRFREELYKQFLSTAYLPHPEKIGNEVLINLQNGTFSITPEVQQLRDFNRNDFITHQLDFAYDPFAEAPRFQKYLDRVLPDAKLQMILAEFIGYVFVKHKILLSFAFGLSGS